jgi:hypothetical protein
MILRQSPRELRADANRGAGYPRAARGFGRLRHSPPCRLCTAAGCRGKGRGQGILIFTCHPSTRDLLLQHRAAARVVEP